MANCKCGATMKLENGVFLCPACGYQRSITKQQSLGELLAESREKIERLEAMLKDLGYDPKDG